MLYPPKKAIVNYQVISPHCGKTANFQVDSETSRMPDKSKSRFPWAPEVETSAVSATLMVQPPLSTRRRHGHVTLHETVSWRLPGGKWCYTVLYGRWMLSMKLLLVVGSIYKIQATIAGCSSQFIATTTIPCFHWRFFWDFSWAIWPGPPGRWTEAMGDQGPVGSRGHPGGHPGHPFPNWETNIDITR